MSATTPVRGPLPREIAFVFQENALFPWSTVIENVMLGMMFQGVPRAEREERARKSLEAVGLADFADHYPAQLSGGMRQRAALARALSLRDRHPADGRAVRRARRADPHDPRARTSRCSWRAPRRPSCSSPTRSARRCSWPTAWRCSRRGRAPSRRSSAWTSRIRASRSSSPRRNSPACATRSTRCCTTRSARRWWRQSARTAAAAGAVS